MKLMENDPERGSPVENKTPHGWDIAMQVCTALKNVARAMEETNRNTIMHLVAKSVHREYTSE